MRSALPFWRWLGSALLVVAGLALMTTVLRREVREARDDVPVIRFAHSLVYDRARDCFAALAAAYEERERAAGRPVRVEQIVIPSRLQQQWIRTRLIGGTAPDLVQQEPMGTDALLVSRFFHPLGRELDEPNPHNAGTPFAGTAWRNTFYDGLEQTGFDFRLSQNFGIPLFGQTSRVVMNLDLWRRVAGVPPGRPVNPPAGFREFLALGDAVERHRRRTGEPVVALAGSLESARLLFGLLHEQQTQRLALASNSRGEMWFDRPSLLLPILGGEREFPGPAERSAYALIRAVGRLLPPGAVSLPRDDAIFRFSQGGAIAIVVSSIDAPALSAAVGGRFATATFPLPLPAADDPDFGQHALGPISERQFPSGGSFMVVRQRDPARVARAVDFLRFITAVPQAQRLSDATGVLSALVGVSSSPEVAPFLPRVEGYPGGVPLAATADQRRIIETNLNRLISHDGGVEDYIAATRPALVAQFPRDLRDRRGQDNVLQMQDALQLAAFFGAGGDDAAARLAELIEVSLWYEWEKHDTGARLEELERRAHDEVQL